jgi:hypothetical protein
LNSDRNADLVAAEWVVSVGGKCGWVEFATVAGRAVVIKNDFSI